MQNRLAPSSSTNFPGSAPPAPCPCPRHSPVALDWPAGILRAGLWVGRLALGGLLEAGRSSRSKHCCGAGPRVWREASVRATCRVYTPPGRIRSFLYSHPAMSPGTWHPISPCKGQAPRSVPTEDTSALASTLVRVSHGQSWGGEELENCRTWVSALLGVSMQVV